MHIKLNNKNKNKEAVILNNNQEFQSDPSILLYIFPVEAEVIKCRRKHSLTWVNRNLVYWYYRMFLEFIELGLSLLGLHKHSPDFELNQISAIAMNFIIHYRSKNE